MTNEVKKVPELRFPEFDGEWEEKTLGEICDKPMYGIGASAVNFDGKNVYVRITDIDEKNRNLISNAFTSPSIIDPKYVLNKNDILFARTGASTGKTYIHKINDENKVYYFAGFLIKFKVNNYTIPEFIFQYTFTKMYQNWVSVMSMRSGQPGINSEEYSKLIINLPLYNEQQKIGEFFSKLDRQIELEEQKLAKLEEQKKGYMQKIFSQELRFKDENGNEYPEWEKVLLKEVTEYSSSKRSSNNYEDLENAGSYPVYDANKEIFKDKSYDMNQRYISILKDGAGAGRLNLRESESSIIGTMGYIMAKNTNIEFLYYRLTLINMKKYIIGSTIPHLYYKDYSGESIYVPIDEEQEKIGKFFKQMDNIIDKQFIKIESLKQRKQGLLQKMFI